MPIATAGEAVFAGVEAGGKSRAGEAEACRARRREDQGEWARRTKSLDALLAVLYLRGISAGDFQEALAALLGKDAPNLSAAVIARLKSE